ncbi:MAG: acylphosphatase [Myxococcaceae bacterium]
MSTADNSRVMLLIEGKVQGVFFRESARREATRLGLTGWVRNLLDGTVETVAEGPADKVETFVVWCHQGPPTAHVERVRSAAEKPTGEFNTFRVEPTR